LTKIWLLLPLERVRGDAHDGFVVLAGTIREAREVAAQEAVRQRTGQEALWRDARRSSCALVRFGTRAKVVLASFPAG